MKKKCVIVALIIACVYASGYVLVRDAHILIHAASFYGATNGVGNKLVASHKVRRGDFIGQIQPGNAFLAFVSDYIFIPLKFCEEVYWNVTVPISGPWPYDE